MARSITSANSIFTLNVPDVFDAPFQLQQFKADDAFDTEDVNPVEVRKGVDGRKASGYTPYNTKQTIAFMADSLSIDFFEAWLQAMDQAQEDFTCSGRITLTGVGKSYILTNGSLSRAKKISDAKKVLEGVTYEITWDTVEPTNI
jgi:hypothetical protein